MADELIDDDLDAFFPRLDPAMQKLGMVISGSLSKGLEVKLDVNAPIEDIAVGRYITIQASQLKFFGNITEDNLDSINPQNEKTPTDKRETFLSEVNYWSRVLVRIHISPKK
jgi:hypothetical protein